MSHEVYNKLKIQKDIEFINIVKGIINYQCDDETNYSIKINPSSIKKIDKILEFFQKDSENSSSSKEEIDKFLEIPEPDFTDLDTVLETISKIKNELDKPDEDELNIESKYDNKKNDSEEEKNISKSEILHILDYLISMNKRIGSMKQEIIIPFLSSLDSKKIFEYFMEDKNLDNNNFKIMSEILNNNNMLLTLFLVDHVPQQIKNVQKEIFELLDNSIESDYFVEVLDIFFLNDNEKCERLFRNLSNHENYDIYKPFYNLIISKKYNKNEYYFDKYIVERVDLLITKNKKLNRNAGLIISSLISTFNAYFMSYFDKEQKEEIIKRLSLKENIYLLPFANDIYFPLYYFSMQRKQKFITKIDFDDKNNDDGIFSDKISFSSELIDQVLARRVKGLYVNKNIVENINKVEYNDNLEKWYDNFETISLEQEYKEESEKLSENIKKMDSDDIIKLSNLLALEKSIKQKDYKNYNGSTNKDTTKKTDSITKSFIIFQNAIINIVINNNDYYSKLIYERHTSTKIFLLMLLMSIKDKSIYDKLIIIDRLKEKMTTLQCKMLEELLFFIDIYKDKNLYKINWGENNLVKIKLFNKKDVIKKMDSIPKKEGLEDERLELYNKILEGNEYRVKIKNDKLLENIQSLKKEFPHFKEFLEYVEKNAKLNKIGDNTFYIPPTILLGPPGIGKTHFVKTLTEKINGSHTVINMESVESSFRLTGLDYGFSTSSAGLIFDNVMKSKYANHIFVLDEIDKMKRNRNIKDDILLTLVEPINAKEFKDSYMDFPVDITNAIWIATANYASQISAPIKSRFQTFNIDYPTFEEKKVIIENIYKYLLRKESWGNKFNDIMNEKCICLLAESFNSVRELRKILLDLCSNNIERIPQTNNLREIELVDFPNKIINVQPWNKRK